jgi:tRNA(Arg) A34 adenosine deaminase TadA
MCLGAVYWARLDRLVFAAGRADAREIGFDDDLIYHELQRPFAERRLPTEQRLQAEARDMMQAWLDVDPTRRY